MEKKKKKKKKINKEMYLLEFYLGLEGLKFKKFQIVSKLQKTLLVWIAGQSCKAGFL